jgi:starvation-inducible outer membrane lipoprotein
MKRNSKVLSVIAAAVIALLAAGCVTVPSADFTQDQVEIYKGA